MEIERKWLVNGWPEGSLPLLAEQEMDQGYLTVRPTCRIRREAQKGGETDYVLCLKSGSGLVRHEVEVKVSREKYDEICEMIGLPLVPKVRRTYLLPDGLHLEVNHVDEGTPTEFWYAEIEYGSEEEARSWTPGVEWLRDYLSDDVTDEPSQTMGEYWLLTRVGQQEQKNPE